jgi:chemotaxis protein methyltransferase CheR
VSESLKTPPRSIRLDDTALLSQHGPAPGSKPTSLANPGPLMSQNEFTLFQQWVERHCSLALGEDKKYLLETRLARILVENQCETFMDLYRKVGNTANPTLRDRIVDAVTTHETLWFRDESAWEALRTHILPVLAKVARDRGEPVRIWSAACSTGQEPYSLAMLIDDFCRTHRTFAVVPDQFQITASDVSAPALVLATAGRYDAISMRRGFTNSFEQYRQNYFTTTDRTSTISAEIRARVKFKRHSLQDPFNELGLFDLVLMRYVTIYFSPDFKQKLWPRICAVMRPGAWLLLGSAETLLNHGTDLTLERLDRAYFYRLTNGAAP